MPDDGPLNDMPRADARRSQAEPPRDPSPSGTVRRRMRRALMAAGVLAVLGVAGWMWLAGGATSPRTTPMCMPTC